MRLAALIAGIAVAACAGAEHRPARDRYNAGVAALAKSDFDGAEKELLAARDQAKVDPELRYRAAFNLGLALAAHADKLRAAQPPDPNGALDKLYQAAGWFQDALKLKERDPDATAALARVQARSRAIADELARGDNGLEPRLDKLIDTQRQLRDDIETTWLGLDEANTAGRDPLAGQQQLTALADRERAILTEAGVVGDLAGDEIDTIGKKAEDERTDEQKVRVVQLQNLDLYLQEARSGLSNARRKLQDLTAGPAHASADNALAALKRAREQLLDPVAALQGVAGDELELYSETDYVVRARAVEKDLTATAPPPVVPKWLTPDELGERQGTLRDRVEEVRARLEAAVTAADTAGQPTQPQTGLQPDPGSGSGSGSGSAPKDPKQEKMIALVKAALPSVIDASTAMDHARTALGGGNFDDAERAEADALSALARAIERFADLKRTLDLVKAEHDQVLHMLDGEAAKDVAPAERARIVKDGLAKNLERMGRVAGLLADEQAKTEAQAQAAAAQADPKQPAPDAQDQAKQLEQVKQMFAQAEQLRARAIAELTALQTALAKGTDPLAPGKAAGETIEQLREMFFSVIEHLQQLIRDQKETRDRTTKATGLDEIARAPLLPDLITREGQHAEMGQAIHDALAKQADAAGGAAEPKTGLQPATPPAGAQGQGDSGTKNLAAAVDEVRLGVGEMQTANEQLAKAKAATNASYDLHPTLDAQKKAIDHLANALRLLQPPQQQQQNKDQKQQQDQQQQQQQQQQDQGKDPDQKDQQQKDQQQKDQQQDQDSSGALQRVRDDEAQRQRDRRKQQRTQPEPVDKDW